MTAPDTRAAGARQTLDAGLAPARGRLDQAHGKEAFRAGLAGGMGILPVAAIALVAAFLAAVSFGTRPFHPLFLPVALLFLPLISAVAAWLGALGARSTSYAAALALDRERGSGDRLSAAVEFTGDSPAGGAPPSPRFVEAAVEDGLARLRRVDAGAVSAPEAARRFPAWRLVAALVIALIPLLVPAAAPAGPGSGEVARVDREAQTGAASAREAEQRKAEAPRGPDRDREASGAPEAAKEKTPGERQPSDPQKSLASGKSGSGTGGDLGGDQRSTAGQGTPRESKGGTPSGGSQGGGGQGESSSSATSGEKKAAKPQTPKQTAQRPAVEAASTEGREEESSASPGGPSRGGGKTSPVGNKRSGLERGADREDEPEIEDEDIEQDEEESEQRGGVMPMTRDRNTSPTRELTISGDGPPRDGRGGPTPPKKSRGTASLVLGITLPDHVRGQLNPGTAKTNLEQVQPQADRDLGAAAAAAKGDRRGTPQARGIPADALDAVVLRYHEFLKRAPAAKPLEPAR